MQLATFTYGTNPVRTIERDGEPWFIAQDVAAVLELTNTTVAIQRLDQDEVAKLNLGGQAGMVTIINEPGLYSLVLGSRKPEARVFKRWITHEVIPTIRKTGSYTTAPALSEDEQLLNAMRILQRRVGDAEARAKELEPKADAWQTLSSADGDYSVRDAAQTLARDHGIQIGQQRLFKWLRDHKWIDAKNRPYQTHVDRGLISLRISSFKFHRTNGQEQLAAPQVRITAKGLETLLAALRAGTDVAA